MFMADNSTMLIERFIDALWIEDGLSTQTLAAYRRDLSLFAQWLHGGTASELKADVSAKLREKTTQFTRFADYAFDDPTRKLDSEEQQLLEGYLDEQGYLRFSKGFQPEKPAPGMLSAWFTSRVHEEGGGFSISKQEIDYHPFEHYV